MVNEHNQHEDSADTLLIVEDDAPFARTLARSFERRGYAVISADGMESMMTLLESHSPRYAVVDLKLKGRPPGCPASRPCTPMMRIC